MAQLVVPNEGIFWFIVDPGFQTALQAESLSTYSRTDFFLTGCIPSTYSDCILSIYSVSMLYTPEGLINLYWKMLEFEIDLLPLLFCSLQLVNRSLVLIVIRELPPIRLNKTILFRVGFTNRVTSVGENEPKWSN
ncbi:hypothetical protein L9F63_022880, partial [Diploptera punctata]